MFQLLLKHRMNVFFISLIFFSVGRGFISLTVSLTRPINAAVFLKDDEMKIFTQFIKSTPLSNRLHITLYEVLPIEQSMHQCVVYYRELTPVPTNSTPFDSSIVYGTLTAEGLRRRFQRICNDNSEPIYPINRLRNIAINSITTTHFLVVDMDMWPVGRNVVYIPV